MTDSLLPSMATFGDVALLGVGYMGGSLVLAARQAGCVGKITGYDLDAATGMPALARGVVDMMAATPAQAVASAQLVVLAAPVGSLAELATQIAPALAPGTLVIDIGSVKSSVISSVRAALPPTVAFVGCHPLAGLEATGVGAATPSLYRDKPCLICTDGADAADVSRVFEFWSAVGAVPVRSEARAHDAFMAAASHLPHVASFALAHALVPAAEALRQAMPSGASPTSLRDTTRIAASSPAVWRDIFIANKDHLLPLIDQLAASVMALRDAVAQGDLAGLHALLSSARAARRTLVGDAKAADDNTGQDKPDHDQSSHDETGRA